MVGALSQRAEDKTNTLRRPKDRPPYLFLIPLGGRNLRDAAFYSLTPRSSIVTTGMSFLAGSRRGGVRVRS